MKNCLTVPLLGIAILLGSASLLTAQCQIGAFIADPAQNANYYSETGIQNYEAIINKPVASVMFFGSWREPFPTADASTIWYHGVLRGCPCIPHYTWEMKTNQTGDNASDKTLESIIAGNQNTYIDTFANACKAFGQPIFIRMGHEMNGNWYPWSGVFHGGNASAVSLYTQAWHYVVKRFNAVGATNVAWVWAPMTQDYPTVSWNALEKYYPGDQWVDWVGVSVYNWGDPSVGGWQTFAQVASSIMGRFAVLAPSKPVMIGEMSCADNVAYDKSQWILDTFNTIKISYPQIKLYNWFHVSKYESQLSKVIDWRIDSAGTSAPQTAMADPYFVSCGDAGIPPAPIDLRYIDAFEDGNGFNNYGGAWEAIPDDRWGGSSAIWAPNTAGGPWWGGQTESFTNAGYGGGNCMRFEYTLGSALGYPSASLDTYLPSKFFDLYHQPLYKGIGFFMKGNGTRIRVSIMSTNVNRSEAMYYGVDINTQPGWTYYNLAFNSNVFQSWRWGTNSSYKHPSLTNAMQAVTGIEFQARDNIGEWGVCYIDNLEFVTNVDNIPPGAVTNLAASAALLYGEVGLRWTSPGDDAYSGLAYRYDIRYSTNYINTLSDFSNADAAFDIPLPLVCGTTQTLSIYDLNVHRPYYFAVRTTDKLGNWSPLSVVAVSTAANPPLPNTSKTQYVNDNSITGDIYCSGPGTVAGIGTKALPFLTIRTCLKQMPLGPDFIVLVDNGTYSENPVITGGDKGSVAGLLTIQGAGTNAGKRAFVNGTGSAVNQGCLTIQGSSFLKISGLYLDNVSGANDIHGISLNVGSATKSRDITIDRCYITNNPGSAIKARFVTNMTVQKCVLVDNGFDASSAPMGAGLALSNCGGSYIERNRAENNRTGMYLQECSGIVINKNSAVRNRRVLGNQAQCSGIFLAGGGNASITSNSAHKNGYDGIQLFNGADYCFVAYNYCASNNNNGMRINGSLNNYMKYNVCWSNHAFDGLKIENTSGNVLEHNLSKWNVTGLTVGANCTNSVYRFNYCASNSDNGMWLNNSSGALVWSNTFIYNKNHGVNCDIEGWAGGNFGNHDHRIARNWVAFNGDGVYIDGGNACNNHDIAIVSNVIMSNLNSGVQVGKVGIALYPSTFLIEHNFIIGNRGTLNADMNGIALLQANFCSIINNTIAWNGHDGIFNDHGGTSHIIRNNIICSNAGWGINTVSNPLTHICTYNDVIGNALGAYSGAVAGTGSFSSNAKFSNTSPASWMSPNYYYLRATSPCINSGDPNDPPIPGGGPVIDRGAREFLYTPIAKFVVHHPTNAFQYVQTPVDITVYDQYNSLYQNYTNTVTFAIRSGTPPDEIEWTVSPTANGTLVDFGAGNDRCVYTFREADRGVVQLTIANDKVESVNIDIKENGVQRDLDNEGWLRFAKAKWLIVTETLPSDFGVLPLYQAGIPVVSAITSVFNWGINGATLTAANYYVVDSESNVIAGATVAVDPANKSRVICNPPPRGWDPNEFHTVYVMSNGLRATNVNGTNYRMKSTTPYQSWHFYTGPAWTTLHIWNTNIKIDYSQKGWLPVNNNVTIRTTAGEQLCDDNTGTGETYADIIRATWDHNNFYIQVRRKVSGDVDHTDLIAIDTTRDYQGATWFSNIVLPNAPARTIRGLRTFWGNRKPEYMIVVDQDNGAGAGGGPELYVSPGRVLLYRYDPVADGWTYTKWNTRQSGYSNTDYTNTAGPGWIEYKLPWGFFYNDLGSDIVPNRVSISVDVANVGNPPPHVDYTPNNSVGGKNWVTADCDNDGNDVPDQMVVYALHHFEVWHDGQALVSQKKRISVKAVNQFGLIYRYSGAVTIDAKSATVTWYTQGMNLKGTYASLAAGKFAYTFSTNDNGLLYFDCVDTTVESVDIRVANTDNPQVADNNRSPQWLKFAWLDHFDVVHDGSGWASVPEKVKFMAYYNDGMAGNKVLTNFTGVMTVSIAAGPDPRVRWTNAYGAPGTFVNAGNGVAYYTFGAADRGVVSLMVIDVTRESIDIEARNAGKGDSDIAPQFLKFNGLHHFVISHDGYGSVSVNETVSIRATYDLANTTLTNYNLIVTLYALSKGSQSGFVTWSQGSANGTLAALGGGKYTYQFSLLDKGVANLLVTDSQSQTLDINVFGQYGGRDDNSEPFLIFQGAGVQVPLMTIRKFITNISLRGAKTTAVIPGTTLTLVVYYSNTGTASATNIVIYDRMPAYADYRTNLLLGTATGWTLQYSTNSAPSQKYNSANYTRTLPADKRWIKWVRWKKPSVPVGTENGRSFVYTVIVR